MSVESPGLHGIRVLIVDNDADTLDVLSMYLSTLGAEVSCAKCSVDALAHLRENKPDIIVTDVVMPDFSGIGLLEIVRSTHETPVRIPVVAMTGQVISESRRRLLDAGFQAFLPKPFEPEKLAHLIAQLARQSNA